MVKSHHVIYLSLMVIVGLLASLVTMVAMNSNPMGNLEPAQAQSGAMDNTLAVAIDAGSNKQLLAVLTRPDGAPRVHERGSTSGELSLSVYDFESGARDAQIRWMGTRRIEFDTRTPMFGLHREQQPRRGSGEDLSPAGVQRMVSEWATEQEERDRRR